MDEFARRLRWARQEQEITLQQLSSRSGRAVSYLCQLEKGVKDNPTRQTVEALADALGVRPAFLFGEVPSPRDGEQAVSNLAATLGQRFRTYFAGLSETTRQELTYGTPERRFAVVLTFLVDYFPQNFTVVELAWQLGMSLGQFHDIRERGAEVSHIYMQQLTRISGVPLSFFTHGSLNGEPLTVSATPAEILRYMEAIRLAHERQVSPEKLAALIRAASE